MGLRTTAMAHIAFQEKLDYKVVDWKEQFSGEQYQAGKETWDEQ
jgi:hypothetical protein